MNPQGQITFESPVSKVPTLRPNQMEPMAIAIDFFKQKKTRPSLLIQPTAFGKSLIAGEVARNSEDRIIILQPSVELLKQNFKKYLEYGGQQGAICSASAKSKKIAHATFATIGTIREYGALFKEYGFKNLLIDEAHLYPREAQSMLNQFLSASGIENVIGMTATAFKLQQNTDLQGNKFSKLLMLTARGKTSSFYKDILHVTQISNMIDNNYWSPLRYEIHTFDKTTLIYNSAKSDYTEESIQKAYESQYVSEKIKDAIANHPERRSTLIFVESVADAQALAAADPDAGVVWGQQNKKDREIVIEQFITGKIKRMYNVSVLSTGFDFPGIDMIIWGRPTASLTLWYQVNGRGVRIDPLKIKKDCLIVDLVDNFGTFGKIESLTYEFDGKWRLYGDNDRLMTGTPMHTFVSREDVIRETAEMALRKKLDKEQAEARKQVKVIPRENLFAADSNPGGVRIHFGKFQGSKVSELKSWYLKWLIEQFDWHAHYRYLGSSERHILDPLMNAILRHYKVLTGLDGVFEKHYIIK